MSQQRQPPRSGGGGSVRRARERMEAGLPPDVPEPPRDYEQRSSPPSALRPRPQMPQAMTKNSPGPIGVAISRPTQVPQWPLAATVEGSQDTRGNPQYKPPAGRGVAPQRPPRPSHVPSMLDASRLQDPTPSFQYRPQNVEQNQGRRRDPEDDDLSPIMTSPMTMNSRASTVSSVGSIPDFPVPAPVAATRRSANLGPPPSSRRGASSYYSQASFVSPIPEESPRLQASHGSYASSAAIPTNWEVDAASRSPRYQYEDEYFDEEDDGFDADRTFGSGDGTGRGHESRDSKESNEDDNDGRGLIRSASIGKRAKPSMVTTAKSPVAENTRQMHSPAPMHPGQAVPLGQNGPFGALTSPDGHRGTVWPMGNTKSPLSGGTGLIDASDSSPDEHSSKKSTPRAAATDKAIPAYSEKDFEANANAMLGAYKSASSLSPGDSAPERNPSPSAFSRLSAIRRPPRLNMDAVRDAEARGSLTSLPDLIRRATRLASMMDRGKRPGSRLNDLSDFPSEIDLSSRDKEMELSTSSNRKSGLSGMIAAFPPPGAHNSRTGTPNGRPMSQWPSGYVDRDMDSDVKNERPRKQGRRCCGLPCWGAIIMILILLLIIAAAVVVPLELLVLNKPKAATATTLSDVQKCEANTATACQNGGTSLIDNGSCACICTNGFTGSTCTTASSTGCATSTFTGSGLTNVTLGDSIVRLISSAQSNFSIPLSESKILARFNNANLSCVSENALVTFDGRSQRIGNASDQVTPTTTTSTSLSSTSSASSEAIATAARRAAQSDDSTFLSISSSPTTASSSPTAIATSNGIIYDSSSLTSSSTSTATSSAPSATSTATFVITEEVLDFARVAVLYILQQSQLDTAVNAQTTLQKFFSLQSFTNAAAMNISLGSNNFVDLVGMSVNSGNGSVGLGKRGNFGKRNRSVRLWT